MNLLVFTCSSGQCSADKALQAQIAAAHAAEAQAQASKAAAAATLKKEIDASAPRPVLKMSFGGMSFGSPSFLHPSPSPSAVHYVPSLKTQNRGASI